MPCERKADVIVKTDFGTYRVCFHCVGWDYRGDRPKAGMVITDKHHTPGRVVRLTNYIERLNPCECEHIAHAD